MPKKAVFLEFDEKKSGKFKFTGFYKSSKDYSEFTKNSNTYQIVFKQDRLTNELTQKYGRRTIGARRKWYSLLDKIRRDDNRWGDGGCCVRLSDAALLAKELEKAEEGD